MREIMLSGQYMKTPADLHKYIKSEMLFPYHGRTLGRTHEDRVSDAYHVDSFLCYAG